MNDIFQRNRSLLNNARAKFNDQLLQPKKPKQEGWYQGFDGRTGLHKIRLSDGSIALCRSDTNGGIGLDQKVSVMLTEGSLVGYFDAMPR
jgi:hypothetical protein